MKQESDKENEKIDTWRENVSSVLREWQDHQLTLTTVSATAGENKFISEQFTADCKKVLTRMTKMIKILSRMATQANWIDWTRAELVDFMDNALPSMKDSFQEMMKHGKTMGLISEQKPRKKARKS